MQYDLVVIGGGPGGYTGAIRAAKLGLKVALVEYRELGGTCLNRGCVPTKALLHSADLYSSKNEWSEFGINAENITLCEDKVYQRKDKIVQGLRDGIAGLIKANGIDLYTQKGRIVDKNTVAAGDTLLTTKYILLATGSSPAGFDPKRPLAGIQDTLNSDDVLEKPIEGQSIVIVGGGVIAVEFASYFAAIGRSVTLVVTGNRILKQLSEDISKQLSAVLKRNGLKIITQATVKQLYRDKAVIETPAGEQEVCGTVITAVGRRTNLDGLGLDTIGLTYDNFIKVDSRGRTAVPNVYACGDITGGMQLAHYAAAGAIVAAEDMAGHSPSVDMTVCPACIYTKPEIAVVGKTQADEGDKTGKFLMGANGKSLIEGVNRGYIKVVADKDDKLLGAELFCLRATDMIGELALAVQKGMTAHDAAAVIHPHPTLMEAVGEAYEDIFGMATHKK